MKNCNLRFFIIAFALFMIAYSVNGQIKRVYRGEWKFTVPDGEPGYTDGIFIIKKDSILTTFTGMAYVYPAHTVTIKSDSIFYMVNIDGIDVSCSLVIENKVTMKGKAVWSSGASEIILKRKN